MIREVLDTMVSNKKGAEKFTSVTPLGRSLIPTLIIIAITGRTIMLILLIFI